MDIKLFLVVSVLVLVVFYEASCRRSPPPYMTKVMQAIITRKTIGHFFLLARDPCPDG